MTLVLTALSPRHIVQVSDRRVVLYSSGRAEQREGHVKAIITQHFACSYTGVADLKGDTAEWLALLLSNRTEDLDGGISSIAGAARHELAKRRLTDQPLEVVCVGWTEIDGHPAPLATVVSNFRFGAPEFRLAQIQIREGRRSAVIAVGQPLSESELAQVNREVRRLCSSGRDTARVIAQVLTETIRKIARGSDQRRQYISKDVLVTSLPRPDLL